MSLGHVLTEGYYSAMSNLQERDVMDCRSCGNAERASEGYPCASCGAFICLMCDMRGVTLCKRCTSTGNSGTVAKPSDKNGN